MAAHHTLVVLVENRFGVLARVTSLISRRGYNIHSLAVAPSVNEQFSKITIVVDAESTPIEQIVKQLHKLINVVEIAELSPSDSVERELLLATVSAPSERRAEIVELVNIFEGKIVNVGHAEIMVTLADPPDKLDDFEELLRPFGIVDVQRTGRVALPKLSRSVAPLRVVESA